MVDKLTDTENLDIITKQTEVYVLNDRLYATEIAAEKAKVSIMLTDLYWDSRLPSEGYRQTEIENYKANIRKNPDMLPSFGAKFILDNLDKVIEIVKG
jgi:hypothetical protein